MDELKVIDKIISIEQEAQELVREAEKQAAELESSAEAKAGELEEDILNRAKKKCRTIKEMEDKFAEDKISEIEKQSASQMAALENQYNENKDKWVSGIVSDILS